MEDKNSSLVVLMSEWTTSRLAHVFISISIVHHQHSKFGGIGRKVVYVSPSSGFSDELWFSIIVMKFNVLLTRTNPSCSEFHILRNI